MKTANVIRLTIGVLTAALVLPMARAADGQVIAENGTAGAMELSFFTFPVGAV